MNRKITSELVAAYKAHGIDDEASRELGVTMDAYAAPMLEMLQYARQHNMRAETKTSNIFYINGECIIQPPEHPAHFDVLQDDEWIMVVVK